MTWKIYFLAVITCMLACTNQEFSLGENTRKFILESNIWIHSQSGTGISTPAETSITADCPPIRPHYNLNSEDTFIHLRRGAQYLASVIDFWSMRNDNHRVKKIQFDGVDSIAPVLSGLFPEVRIISVLGRAGLKGISGFRKLEKISFRHVHFPYPPEELPKLQHLRFLSIQHGHAVNLPLGKLKRLESLWIKNCSIKNYKEISQLTNLRQLELRRIGTKDSLCNLDLSNMTCLTKLALSGREYEHIPKGLKNANLKSFIFHEGKLSQENHWILVETRQKLKKMNQSVVKTRTEITDGKTKTKYLVYH